MNFDEILDRLDPDIDLTREDELRDMLVWIQWSSVSNDKKYCPWCANHKSIGHMDNCQLYRLIK